VRRGGGKERGVEGKRQGARLGAHSWGTIPGDSYFSKSQEENSPA